VQPAGVPILARTVTPAPTRAAKKSDFKIKGNKTIVFINKSKEGDAPNFVEEHRREESLNLDITGQESSVNIEAKNFFYYSGKC
jgi:hypothetical protein